MCATQQSLREALRAVDTHDRALMNTVQGCHYSVDGVPAELIQDNVSMIKVKIGRDPNNRMELWTLPESIKSVNKR